jgi:hypothetical protein
MRGTVTHRQQAIARTRVPLRVRLRLLVDGLAVAPALAGVGYTLWWGFWPTVQLIDRSDAAFHLFLLWVLCFLLAVDGWQESGRLASPGSRGRRRGGRE